LQQLILNVDDYEPQRYQRSAILRRAGFHVIEACSGREALDLVRERQPALLVLDVNLPDIDGMEVCRRLKADSFWVRADSDRLTQAITNLLDIPCRSGQWVVGFGCPGPMPLRGGGR
jgi:CheY-like chemotaxis protein